MWIAHLIGSGEREKIPNAIHSAMLLSILLGLLLGIIGQWLAKPLLLLIHTPSDILKTLFCRDSLSISL